MREDCQHAQEIVRRKKELKRRYGEAGCSEIEVGIEFENGAAEQHGADMHQQEKRQIAARDCLNPGRRTTALLPVAQHKPDTLAIWITTLSNSAISTTLRR